MPRTDITAYLEPGHVHVSLAAVKSHPPIVPPLALKVALQDPGSSAGLFQARCELADLRLVPIVSLRTCGQKRCLSRRGTSLQAFCVE